jgi:hypothetical protein
MADVINPAFGNLEVQVTFTERHKLFVERLENISKACSLADVIGPMSRNDMAFYALSRLVIEDFNEIILLCANGSTTGGMKILRGMFERAVTACYLDKNPDKVDAFVSYFPVSQYKAAKRVREDLPGALPDEMFQDIEERYEGVKERYIVPDCKKCNTTMVNFSWTRLDIIAMAKKVGGFEAVTLFGYYVPMTETHSTMGAVIRRVRFDKEDNSFWYEYGVKGQDESNSLLTANYLLLKVLDTFKNHFKIEALEEPLSRCCSDFIEIWRKSPPEEVKENDKSTGAS